MHDLVWAANKHFRSSSIFLVFVTDIKVLPQPPTHTLSQFNLLHNLITLFLKFLFNITLISPPPGNCNHSITKHVTFSSTALSIHRSDHPVIQHYITYANNEMSLKKLRHNIILSFLLTLPNCCITRGSSYKTLHILFFSQFGLQVQTIINFFILSQLWQDCFFWQNFRNHNAETIQWT